MPIGIICNCGSVALGGVLGKLAGRVLPKRTRSFLSGFFGISSITIGISLIHKSDSLSPVMLALILGAILGEAADLEGLLARFPLFLRKTVAGLFPEEQTEALGARFTGVLVLICSGSMGLLGAMTEGMTGDPSILITKSILDLFGAAIFAAELGLGVTLIAVPQFIIYVFLYGAAGFIMPLVTSQMTADFMCCGGIIALATGIRVAEIKFIRAASLLPALILVMPVSAVWHRLF